MRTITTIFALLLCVTLTAQTTHNIPWFVGASPGTLSIEEGDTVNWIWDDGAPHSVTSEAGSTDTWDSGVLAAGSEFSRVFPDEGTNPYFCTVHPSMVGVIEVTPVLSVEDESLVSLQYYPNPVKDFLSVDSNDVIDSMQLYDVNGRLLVDAPVKNPSATLYMGIFNDGMYFIKINSGKNTKTIQVILDK